MDSGDNRAALLAENQALRDRIAALEADHDIRQQEDVLHASLYQAALALMQRLELQDLLQDILNRAAQLAGARHAFINLLDADADVMRFRMSLGLFNRALNTTVQRGKGLVGRVWDTGETLIIYDYDNWEDRLHNIEPGIIYSVAGLPLFSGSVVTGVMAVVYENPEQVFTPNVLRMLSGFANLASIALENARLYQELKDSQHFVSRLLNAAPVLLYIYDLDPKADIYVNEALTTLFGYSWQESNAISRNPCSAEFAALFHADDIAILRDTVNQFRNGNQDTVVDVEFRLRHRDGTYRWIQARNTVFTHHEDDSVHQFLGVGIDITERRQAEQQSMALLLEQERVEVLAGFVRDAGHSFRTPLSTINTSLYLLQHQTDPERRARHIDIIQRQVSYLDRLVEAMVQMLQLDRGRPLSLVETDLNMMLRNACVNLGQFIQDKQQHLVLDLGELPLHPLDQYEMNRAINAIIENAVRYTPPQGTITIQSRVEDDIRIAIADTGIGIDEHDLPHVFDHFFRGGSAQDAGGLGMGLAIAQKIIHRHFGTIEVESTLGAGSRFTIRLPLNAL